MADYTLVIKDERPMVSISTPGPQGPSGVRVSETQPDMSTGGIWIQTGLGPEGEDWTIWFEDNS